MDVNTFIKVEKPKIIAKLAQYLSGEIDHDGIQAHVNNVFEKWDLINIGKNDAYLEGEKEFWCSLWAAQHLASEDHWSDGVAQTDLGVLLKVLKGELTLPGGYEGRRP